MKKTKKRTTMFDFIKSLFQLFGACALSAVILFGSLVALIILLNSFCSFSGIDWIIIGVAVVIFIPIMIFLDKRKKEREKEPWKHDI